MKFKLKKQKQQGRQPLNQAGKPKAAFSYYAGDAPRKQDSVRARQASEHRLTLFKRLRLAPTILAAGVILLSIVYSTTLSTSPGIVFAGEQSIYRTKAEYIDGAAKILGSSVFNKSKLTISTANTEMALLKAYPEVDAVTLSLPVIGRRPTITMHVRAPSLILTTSTNAYVLDYAGKVVADASQLQSSVKETLLTVQDQSGLLVKVGNQALTTESVTFISNIKAQLKAKNLTITQATLPITPNELDIHIKDIGYFLKTDMTGDARLQIGAFLAAKDSGVVPTEYMDIRVEERVFYK